MRTSGCECREGTGLWYTTGRVFAQNGQADKCAGIQDVSCQKSMKQTGFATLEDVEKPCYRSMMAEPYLAELKKIIERLSCHHDEMNAVFCKHFFSGAAAYVDDHIFMSLSPVGLALKLPEEECRFLFSQGGNPLRYFPKAPIKKGYSVLPISIVQNDSALGGWIVRSIEFARG